MRGEKNNQKKAQTTKKKSQKTNTKKQGANQQTSRQYKIMCRKDRDKSQRSKTPALPILRHASGTRTVLNLTIMREEGKDSLSGFCPNICKNYNNKFLRTKKGRNNTNAYRLPKGQATQTQREAAWKNKNCHVLETKTKKKTLLSPSYKSQ